jgi:hypothetical protein
VLPLALALIGCGATSDGTAAAAHSPWLAPPTGSANVTSGSAIERFFPLVDGMVYTYLTENEVADRGLLVARVHRIDATHGELRFPNGAKGFELSPQGVRLVGRGETSFVLQTPLAKGTRWRGEHGGNSEILEATVSIDTPAGHYDGCVRTLEQRLGDRPTRYATTFCPDVGVVQIEVATGANFERATLKSYAPAMRMRDDGTEKLPAGTPDMPAP